MLELLLNDRIVTKLGKFNHAQIIVIRGFRMNKQLDGAVYLVVLASLPQMISGPQITFMYWMG